MGKKQRRGKRFPLVIYERMWKRWAFPCLLIIPASFALWWVAPLLSVTHTLYRALALVPALAALGLLVFTFMARRLTWVECREGHLHIRTPIYPLAVSYARIKDVLPQPFNQIFKPSAEKAVRRSWLNPYWGQTALLVRISKYPVNKKWLRLWLSPYLLSPTAPGFVFLVEDWMGLSRQLDDFRTAWGARQAERRQQKLMRQTR